MFDSHSSKVLPPRMQHLAWRSHQYDFLIVHITGNANAADSLSRLPLKRDDCSDSGLVCENYVPFVYTSNMSDLQAVTLSDMKFETSKDATLSKLLVEIQSGKWSHEQQLKAYSGIRKELSVFEGVILRRNRIVVPQLLRKQILKIVHEVHQGILKTKQFLRARFFWPAWIKLLKLWLKVAVLVFWTSRWINTHHFSRCLYLVVHGSKKQWFSWDLLMVSTYWHTLTTTLPIQKHASWKR